MPEYVYALHDFTPQVADEIEFKVGDRIEVIEKDDLYGDGWWQVSICLLSTSGNCLEEEEWCVEKSGVQRALPSHNTYCRTLP